MIPQYSNPPSAGVHPLQTSLQPLHTAPPPPPPPPPPPLPLHYHRPRVPILAINDDPMLSAGDKRKDIALQSHFATPLPLQIPHQGLLQMT